MKDHVPKEIIESNIHSFKVYGNTILIDYNKEEIMFPENINQDEIENIASYLVDEGFIKTEVRE
jgi:translation initiation factor 6 (eIF-6)